MNAIKQKVIVQNGVIAFPAGDLADNSEVEVVVTLLADLQDQDIEDDDDGEMPGLVRFYLEAKAEIAASGEKPIPWEQLKAELERDRE